MKARFPINTLQKDVDIISGIPIVERLLNVICQTTGMGFAAIARVTDDSWVACSVVDRINFGMKPGDELKVATTLCDEVRQQGKAVVIEDVSNDVTYCDHHTPAMYGFRSYISVPVVKRDGTFFGTLCAFDPSPNLLNTEAITGMFKLFSELIAFHIDAVETLKTAAIDSEREHAFKLELENQILVHTQKLHETNQDLLRANKDLSSVNYVASHDLQEPLRKIQTFISMIERSDSKTLSTQAKDNFVRLTKAAARMQTLITDLFNYSQAEFSEKKYKKTNLTKILDEVKSDLKEELDEKGAVIISEEMCTTKVIPFQLHQLFYNLISNSIKFSSPDRTPQIEVRSRIISGSDSEGHGLRPTLEYCHISIADNGIGFDQQYSERIFELFKRLHSRDRIEGTGIGLAIVKRVVDNHHGIIEAKGIVNQGATFDVYLPVDL